MADCTIDGFVPPSFLLVRLLRVSVADWHRRAVVWLSMCGRRRGGGRRPERDINVQGRFRRRFLLALFCKVH